MGKLTPSQLRVLQTVATNRGPSLTAWALGRNTCEALRKRGLIEGAHPIRRFYGDPFIHITDAGLAALSSGARSDE